MAKPPTRAMYDALTNIELALRNGKNTKVHGPGCVFLFCSRMI